jgi:large subunit ribosomal protein L9
MEVLLLQDVAGIGKKNDLLVVGDGFALNCLLPRRMALVATPLVRKRYADLIRRRAEEREREKSAQAGVAQAITGKALTLTRKTTKTGKLYAAVTERNIVDALKEQHQLDVKEDAVEIATPIKALGAHKVSVKLAGQSLTVDVLVEAEKVAVAA